jgi:hypothetical protein
VVVFLAEKDPFSSAFVHLPHFLNKNRSVRFEAETLWCCRRPDGKFVYVTNENKERCVFAYAIDPSIVARLPIEGFLSTLPVAWKNASPSSAGSLSNRRKEVCEVKITIKVPTRDDFFELPG